MNVLKTLADLHTYHRELGKAIKAFENLARRRSPESAGRRARRPAYRKAKSGLPATKSTALTKSQ
ncbi:MAG: hypothetical protein EXQ47_12420 [Bryobacterales bacterium]|nr:hypothetical protein [Bryobacterales bacterium]